jgi:hypothetical protein
MAKAGVPPAPPACAARRHLMRAATAAAGVVSRQSSIASKQHCSDVEIEQRSFNGINWAAACNLGARGGSLRRRALGTGRFSAAGMSWRGPVYCSSGTACSSSRSRRDMTCR